MVIKPVTTRVPYVPPIWAQNVLKNHPQNGRLNLANLPTPVHHIFFPSSKASEKDQIDNRDQTKKSILSKFESLQCNLFVKHDDATGGVELGGNKIRKLEFLLADALAQNCQSVVTIGGEQSNHCRATASACRKVGLEPHLILRTRRKAQFVEKSTENSAVVKEKKDFGFVGNILFDRIVGSHIYLVSPGEYGRFGSRELVNRVCNFLSSSPELSNSSGTPKERIGIYPIPVGGSNAIGTWGYIEAVRELMLQLNESNLNVDHIVFATGSGGTATGIVLGIALAFESENKHIPQMHAVGVCDNPDYFYDEMASIAQEMGFSHPSGIKAIDFVKKYVTVHQGKGSGYAISTEEELEFINKFAVETGVTLDPVYSGKAMHHFVTKVMVDEEFRGRNILFWHTGGTLGLYDKIDSMLSHDTSSLTPMDLYSDK